MPFCKLCGRRIDVSQTGVNPFKCRSCGRVVCKAHFLQEKGICLLCAGVPEAEIPNRNRPFSSFVRRDKSKPRNLLRG